MKQTNLLLAAILLVVLAGCVEYRQSHDDLITVDLSKSYPKKELILQDLMDVEYIALETTDEFLTQGLVQDVGKEYLLVSNRNRDGDIFIFDRKTGKGLRKINRQGQGAEEYAGINRIILDESNDEILVMSPGNKILVYDLYGEYKRCLKLDREVSSVFDYDKSNLIGYDMSDYHNKGKDRSKSYHILISKQDGSITREIFIPFKTIDTPVVTGDGGFVASYSYQIRQSHGKCTLMDTSSDTLYNYAPDGTLTPFIARTPSAHTMEPEVFLYMGIYTDRYYFMQTVKNVFNFEKGNGFYTDELMYDKEEKAVYQVAVYNGDYAEKRTVAMTAKPINSEIEDATSLNASRLVEIYKKGQLKDGQLKEIASRLSEEDNPVIMLVRQKTKVNKMSPK
ncbi:6-bladed beta-propeller [Parabacteroides hominis]|uniref:6-bladed beta-propeller n=1 Tax=Parabacteroides hominis TaxID=2763057 RepID=A0ABR7DNC2_9BACT|nr:6-bladed beta-propeller [Parabacteroides hominis]MBC5632938.1 6-bladed beta-propeller [Parabacteroides hominis]MBD9166408.1 6-bladed beta-propeller [Parabacteroides johnsonii]